MSERDDQRMAPDSAHQETIERLAAVAAALTTHPPAQRDLVEQMAVYLVHTRHEATGSRNADRDLLDPWQATLPDRQRQVLALLLTGRGVRDIGRRLGISHVAVIKHREKILYRLRKFLVGAPPPPASIRGLPAQPAGGAPPVLQTQS
jgi:DNA-binding NarL/FixJ family response regulator